ncbi:hypothetical protein E0L11_02125 [Escherichia coli]|uniref:Uncharacterized protein n=2 Tax=Escherichia coli TaxID=562 RepID=A0A3L1G1T0_ECOLX|nr:hypothetical protein [Escherichia coli]EAC1458944.1 hypothetical protein [Escherichia coli]EAC1687451.1 hypothetical protein [Escherichia coli]EEU9421137.1 hypothetical protein [Escherichia coli]EEV5756861.1 hypothetical protein [Escherichia coli]
MPKTAINPPLSSFIAISQPMLAYFLCSQNTGVRFYNGWRFFVRMISHVFFTEIVFYTSWRFLIAIYLWFLDPSLL